MLGPIRLKSWIPMVRTDSWSSRMLALISLELTWTPSIFTCQTGLKSMSYLRYKADQFSSISLWIFQDPPQSLCLTRVNFVQQFEVTCTTVLMHILKVFIFLFFLVESSGWTKMGLERHPLDPHHSENLMEYLSTTKGDDSSVHTSKWLSIPVISHRQ